MQIVFWSYSFLRLYPVDKTRVNEFGQSFENEATGKSDSVEKVAHGKTMLESPSQLKRWCMAGERIRNPRSRNNGKEILF